MSSTKNDMCDSISVSSLSQVLEEAMQEICSLEDKNSKMQDVLSELHHGILGMNDSLPSFSTLKNKPTKFLDKKNAETDLEHLHEENKSLLEQLNGVKNLLTCLTGKFGESLDLNHLTKLSKERSHSDLTGLKKKLSTSSLICQQLVGKNKTHLDATFGEDVNNSVQSTSFFDQSCTDELQRQLTDALEKNLRWQNYNAEREEYVRLLLAKYNQNCKDLQMTREKLALVTSTPDKLAVEQRRYFDKLLVDARQELEHQRNQSLQVNTELMILKDKHKEEVDRLEKGLERWQKRFEEQSESIAHLSANYENERRRSSSNAIENREKQSQIQLLHQQVKMFSEDFRSEKKEKVIAVSEVEKLRKIIDTLQNDLDKFRKKAHVSFGETVKTENIVKCSSKPHAVDIICKELQRQNKVRKGAGGPRKPDSRSETPTTGLTSPASDHGITVRRRQPPPPPKSYLTNIHIDNQIHADRYVKTGTVHSKSSRKIETLPNKSTRKRSSDTDSILQCPNCGKQYNINEHMSLLEHIDICDD